MKPDYQSAGSPNTRLVFSGAASRGSQLAFHISALMPKQYRLSPQQFSAVSVLSGQERYRHFVGRVSDWQSVWGLRNDSGWVCAGDDDGNNGFPVWPHPDYALACATGEWADNSPSPIEVHEFVERWLPNMAAEGVLIAVFPTPAMRGVFVPALALQAHIQEELAKIE